MPCPLGRTAITGSTASAAVQRGPADPGNHQKKTSVGSVPRWFCFCSRPAKRGPRRFCGARLVARNDLPGSPGQIYSMERGPQAVHRLPGEGRHAAVEKAVQPVPPDMAAGPCRPRYGRPPVRTYSFLPQHFLYFKPLPQGQGSLRPGFLPERTGCLVREPSSAPAVAVGFIICSR